MFHRIFAVYDAKVGVYGQMFVARTREEGQRIFGDVVNDPNTVINRHPEDFHLFEIATFDDANGTVLPHKASDQLGKALEYVIRNKPSNGEMFEVDPDRIIASQEATDMLPPGVNGGDDDA